MNAETLPSVDAAGRCSSILGARPADWPWATPCYLLLNVWATPGPFVAGVRATPDGDLSIQESRREDLESFELIERWRGRSAVAETFGPLPAAIVKDKVDRMFSELPIRFLTRAGQVVRINHEVVVVDDWPESLAVSRNRDLGVIAALLFETAASRGAEEKAREFRARIYATMPGTETLVMFRQALAFASNELRPFLDRRGLQVLDKVLHALKDIFNSGSA